MKARGFTLIEVIVVMAIIATLAGIMVPFMYRVWESNEIEVSKERMLDLKRAMVGDSRMIQNGIRTNYGYVGEHGQLPEFLADALSYMPSGFDPNKYNKDEWGNEFIYTVVTIDGSGRRVSAKLTSNGPDRRSGTSDDINENSDPSVALLNESETTPTNQVQGNLNFVFTNATAAPVTPSYSSKITVIYTGISGLISAATSCILLNIGQIESGYSKPVVQSFSSSFPLKLPVGKSTFRPVLYTNNTCSDTGTQSVNEMAIFINDGLNSVFVNLPTINYAVTAP